MGEGDPGNGGEGGMILKVRVPGFELLQYIIKVVIHVALICISFSTWRIFSKRFTTVLKYLNFLRLE